jgi:hypothetical protein
MTRRVKIRTKAGHRRAFARARWYITHWRCPQCLEDVRPSVYATGLTCPHCGGVDPRYHVSLKAVPSRAGFWWKAEITRRDG